MTLIVGIRCQNGVVMAADGAATYGTLAGSTIRQSTQKLTVVRDSAIVGVSGPVGLGQLFCGKIDELSRGGAFSGREADPDGVMRKLRSELWPDVQEAMEQARVASKIIGNKAVNSALSDTLVALWLRGKPCLIHLDQQCAPERATDDLPFMAIGSGQPIADPFLAFLRERFWPDEPPKLSDGRFVAYWTLRHAINTNPGGVADPIELAVLEEGDGGPVARKLDDETLDEHKQHVEGAEEYLADYRAILTGEPDDEEEIEAPPEPEEG